MFTIILGGILVVSVLHLIDMRGSSKRLDRNVDLLERYIKLLEEKSNDQ